MEMKVSEIGGGLSSLMLGLTLGIPMLLMEKLTDALDYIAYRRQSRGSEENDSRYFGSPTPQNGRRR